MLLASVWADDLTAIGTAVGALATAAAVIVALFGPGWQKKRTRPNLSIRPDGGELSMDADGSSTPLELRLLIYNEGGKATAQSVEVFVTATRRGPPGSGTAILVEDANINFDRPRADSPGRSTATVPAGHSRPLTLALFGPPRDVEACFPESVRGGGAPKPHGERFGALSILGLTGGAFGSWGIPWLTVGETYDVVLVVTGENFNALTVSGRLRLRDEFIEPAGPRIMLLGWLEEPRELGTDA